MEGEIVPRWKDWLGLAEPSASPRTMPRKRVFLIDDEAEMTQLVAKLLGFNDFEVASSNEPEEGLARLLDEDHDAVVLDLMMPGLDGFGVIARLRESERHKATPIVVLSAKALEDGERKRLMKHGVRYLPKPVSPNRLVKALQEVLG